MTAAMTLLPARVNLPPTPFSWLRLASSVARPPGIGAHIQMRVQPRRELLEIWGSLTRSSWKRDHWLPGGRFGANSMSDAEQLLCLLLPATELETFHLDRPDQTDGRMEQVLRALGTATDIPRTITRILTEYFERYTEEGTPVFSGGLSEDENEHPMVDSYAISITLCLAVLGFARMFRHSVYREDAHAAIVRLENAAGVRLSAAMVGLLRSFSVYAFPVDSREGKNLCATVDQEGLPRRVVVERLHRELRQIIASCREVLIGSGSSTDLELPDRLFECGWAWSVVRDAPEIETYDKIGEQPAGAAADRPILHFTVTALDAIEDLFSERTRVLGLLNEDQQRLARALQLRSDLTRGYWATLATFGDGRHWPLENIPWRTTDGDESDYYTLQVTSLAMQGLAQVRGNDAELARIGRVLATLAERGRITARAVEHDPNLRLHFPGVRLALPGSDGAGPGDLLVWAVPGFAALLLQRVAGTAALISDAEERARLLDLCDAVWEHLEHRRLTSGPAAGLWDQPARVFPQLPTANDAPCWYYTERVVQALVTVAKLVDRPPARNDELARQAAGLLREAEQVYDRELVTGAAEGGPSLRDALQLVEVMLRRAREVRAERPGTAAALAYDALRRLDRLAAAGGDISTEM